MTTPQRISVASTTFYPIPVAKSRSLLLEATNQNYKWKLSPAKTDVDRNVTVDCLYDKCNMKKKDVDCMSI